MPCVKIVHTSTEVSYRNKPYQSSDGVLSPVFDFLDSEKDVDLILYTHFLTYYS